MVSRLFNIRPTEWPRFLALYGMGFLFHLGLTWGEIFVEAAFLVELGVSYLPLVFTLHGVMFIITTAFYTPFVDRIKNDTLLLTIVALSMLSVGVGLLLVQLNTIALALIVLSVLVRVVRSAFNLHWWTYVSTFYDTRSAKRIVPVLSSASRSAIIVAGLTIPFITGLAFNIVLLWLGTLSMVGVVGWLLMRRSADSIILQQPTLPMAQPNPAKRASYWVNVQQGYRYVLQSSYLRWMALAAFTLVVIFSLLNFQGSKIMQAELGSVEAMSHFVAQVSWITNLILLPIQLFLFNRLVSWMGLGNAHLIYPVVTSAIAGFTIVAPGSLITAVGTVFQRTTLRFAIYEPTNNLLYNAVPLHIKGRARAFIDGLMVPLGLLAGSAVVVLVQWVGSLWFFSLLLGVATAIYLGSALVIRRRYALALVSMLEQEDFLFLMSAPDELMVTDPVTLKRITTQLATSTNPEFTIFLAKILAEIGGNEITATLVALARSSDARLRAALVHVMAVAELRGENVGQLYTELLHDDDGQVRQAALLGLQTWAGAESTDFCEIALDVILNDPDVNVQIQALPTLMRSGDMFYQAAAFQVVDRLLNHVDPLRRAQGIDVLGELNDGRFIRHLIKYLHDPADQVRLEAALVIETLSQHPLPPTLCKLLWQPLTAAAHDPVERIREAMLVILGHIGHPEADSMLAQALDDPSEQIREVAVQALVRSQQRAIAPMVTLLESPVEQPRKLAAVVLTRINRERYAPLLMTHIQANLHTMYHHRSLIQALQSAAEHRSLGIALDSLHEANYQLATAMFYFVSALHPNGTIALVREALASPMPHIRANAVEALEALTSPGVAQLAAPLFDPTLAPAEVARIRKTTWQEEAPDAKTAFAHLLKQRDPWLRALSTFALGSIGLQTVKAQPARRTRTTNVLDRLLDAPAEVKPREPFATTPGAWYTSTEVEQLIQQALDDDHAQVRDAARSALAMLQGRHVVTHPQQEDAMLSLIEKLIFLREVPFFQGMTIEQLKVLANACEEEFFMEDTRIFNVGDPGGTLYIVVSGRVAIEQETGRKGSTVRLSTLDSHGAFGEMTLFDGSPWSATAIAIHDTLVLRLRREPLIALVRQHPNLSLELINVLSQRLREANEQVAKLSRAKPRELHKLYDRLDDFQPTPRTIVQPTADPVDPPPPSTEPA